MCTGKCAKFIGISLYPLALLSIICNIFLFFPDFQITYSKEDAEGLYRLTDEIKYMGGVVGGGILVRKFYLVLLSCFRLTFLLVLSDQFLGTIYLRASILASGIHCRLYISSLTYLMLIWLPFFSFKVLIPAIHIHSTGREGCCANRCGMFLSIIFAAIGVVGALYSGVIAVLGLVNGPVCLPEHGDWSRPFMNSTENYLGNPDSWDTCKEPENIVEFNIGLFATLLVAACLELLLCGFQVLNGLFGCICGTCKGKEVVA